MLLPIFAGGPHFESRVGDFAIFGAPGPDLTYIHTWVNCWLYGVDITGSRAPLNSGGCEQTTTWACEKQGATAASATVPESMLMICFKIAEFSRQNHCRVVP